MRPSPSFDSTTKLVARALGLTAAELLLALRPAVLDDLPSVLMLRQLDFGRSITWDDRAYLTWRYRLGRMDCGLGELWVVIHNAVLLGMIGTEDMVCAHAGRRLEGLRGMDIRVDARAKNSGLGVWLNQALFRQGDFTLVVGSNPNSIGIMKRLYQPLPPGCLYVRPVDFRRYLERRFGTGAVTWIGTRLGNLTMRCWRHFSQLIYERTVVIRPVDRFDESVAVLVANASIDSDEVRVERSAAYLNRRLFDNPRARYKVWGAYREGEWLGYIAWRVVHTQDGETRMHIMDWQVSAPRRASTLGALLAFTSRHAELSHCSSIATMLPRGGLHGVLRQHGFLIPRNGVNQVVVVHAQDASLLETLRSAKWPLTDLSFDLDGC